MIIALNITPAMRQTTGIGTYAKEIVSALLEPDKENRYILFFSKNPFSQKGRVYTDFIKDGHKVKLKALGMPYWSLNFLWNKLGIFPVEYLCGECDIFHSLDMLSPLAKKAKILTTIHDINWLVFNDISQSKKRTFYREVSKSLKRSKAIITDSIFTKQELLKHFPFLKEDKIEVIYLGVSDRFRPIDRTSLEDTKKKYGWGEFILYIGVLDQARKNLIRLVKAYSNLREKGRIREKLVLCGRVSKNSKELLRLIDEVNLGEEVVIHSKWIPDEDIPLIYNMARILVYPSLYEGFGLPVLEAMACGVPVVTSKMTSIAEIGGDACLYVDPYSSESIANGIEKILNDKVLYERLSNMGLEHVKKFTWHNTAHKTFDLYKKTLNSE